MVMKMKNFPKKIQFWTRAHCDNLELWRFDDERIDLKYPHFFWDNELNYTDVLVHPDPYMFSGFT